jgi:hypothetical protein
METMLLMSLKPAKRAYAAGEFDYVGGAGMKNFEQRDDRAASKAHEHLAKHKSNEPNPAKSFYGLMDMYREKQLPEGEVEVFHGGESFTLDDGVYDLRATMRWLAIVRNRHLKRGHGPAWKNPDRSANESGSSYWFISSAFRISFYRAARSLIDCGMLIACDPVEKGREVRFVSMAPEVERLYADDDE